MLENQKKQDASVVTREIIRFESDREFKQSVCENLIKKLLKSCEVGDLEEIKGTKIEFDLSSTQWYDLGALLWFIAILNKLKINGNEFKILLPEADESASITEKKVWDFLTTWRFFKALKKCVDDPINLLKQHQIRYYIDWDSRYQSYIAVQNKRDEKGNLVYDTNGALAKDISHSRRFLEIKTIDSNKDYNIVQDSIEKYLNKKFTEFLIESFYENCGWTKEETGDFIDNVIREGLENSFLFSTNNFTNVALRTDEKYVTLAICDNGIGIPDSLRKAFETARGKFSADDIAVPDSTEVKLIEYFASKEMIDHSIIIQDVLREGGLTSQIGRNGTGLYFLRDFVIKHKGELRVRSGRACVDFAVNPKTGEEADPKAEKDLINSPGTMLRIRVPKKKHA